MHRTPTRRLIAAATIGLLSVATIAAGEADGPEIVDGCGTDSHALGENVDHPRFEGIDIDTVDLLGSYAAPGPDPDVRELVGFEVVFAMCGELGDVPTGEVIRTTWTLDPVARGVDECDRLRGAVEIVRSIDVGTLSAEYVETCIVDESSATPAGGSTSASFSERLRLVLPADALTLEGLTYTVAVRNADLADVTAGYVAGEALTAPNATGAPLLKANVDVSIEPLGSAGPGGRLTVVDRTEPGADHVLGSDA